MTKNNRGGGGGAKLDGSGVMGATTGGDGAMAPALAPPAPPLSPSPAPNGIMRMSVPAAAAPTPPSSGLATVPSATGSGTAPSAYGTTPQAIANSAYNPRVASMTDTYDAVLKPTTPASAPGGVNSRVLGGARLAQLG